MVALCRVLILAVVLSKFSSPSFVLGQSLTGNEVNWLTAMLASQNAAIEAWSSGSFRFSTARIKAGIEESADGQVW